jgi:hypothetical protein
MAMSCTVNVFSPCRSQQNALWIRLGPLTELGSGGCRMHLPPFFPQGSVITVPLLLVTCHTSLLAQRRGQLYKYDLYLLLYRALS